MADNFVANAGSGGDTFGADDIDGVKYARTKIIIGADGTNDGDVSSANPLPVTAAIAAAQTLATVTSITNVVHVDDNSSTLSIDDGGGTITVDGTVAVSGSVAVTGTFWQATQPVSIATAVPVTDNSGSLTVDDGGSSLTVDGTVAATQSGTWNVTNTGTFAVQAAQSGTWNVGTVTAVTGITNALPAGTNAIGKLAANSGVDIGDVDVTSISAGTNTIGGVISQTSTSAAYDGTTACTIKRLSGVATASGANTILAAVAAKKFRVLALSLLATSTTAVGAYVYNGDYMLLGDSTNKLTLDMDGVGGPAGLVLPFNQGGWFETDTANEALALNLGAATPVIWCVTYVEVA